MKLGLPPDHSEKFPLVGVVGPCAAGKTTLIQALELAGIHARHIAQEHSFVQDMWKRLTDPDVLVYLDVSFPLTIQRRKLDWNETDYLEEVRRLAHARAHADLVIQTDDLSPSQVFTTVTAYLQKYT